jgi:hypothetical protein
MPARYRELRTCEVRYLRVQLPPPTCYSNKNPVQLWIIHVVESAPPEGAKLVEWFLLSTVDFCL